MYQPFKPISMTLHIAAKHAVPLFLSASLFPGRENREIHKKEYHTDYLPRQKHIAGKLHFSYVLLSGHQAKVCRCLYIGMFRPHKARKFQQYPTRSCRRQSHRQRLNLPELYVYKHLFEYHYIHGHGYTKILCSSAGTLR